MMNPKGEDPSYDRVIEGRAPDVGQHTKEFESDHPDWLCSSVLLRCKHCQQTHQLCKCDIYHYQLSLVT